MVSNRTYDLLRFIAELFLPAVATLYAALAGLWGLPYVDQIVGTIVAADAFLGVFVNYLRTAYKAEVEDDDT